MAKNQNVVSTYGALKTEQLEAAIWAAAEADVPLMIWGPTGTGKSTIVKNTIFKYYETLVKNPQETYLFAQNPNEVKALTGIDFKDMRIAHADPADWGIPRPAYLVEGKNGGTDTVMTLNEDSVLLDNVHVYTRPSWWPHESSTRMFFMFLDELNRGETFTENCTMEMTQERTLRGRPGPKLMRLFSACNPSTGGYTSKELDSANKARWCHIQVAPNKQSFLEACHGELDVTTIQMLSGNTTAPIARDMGDYSKMENCDWDLIDQVEYAPRTLSIHARLGNYIHWLFQTNHPKWQDLTFRSALRAMSNGLLGTALAAAWWQYFEEDSEYTVENVLNGNTSYEKIVTQSKGGLGNTRLATIAFMMKSRLNDHIMLGNYDRPTQAKRAKNFVDFVETLMSKNKDIANAMIFEFVKMRDNPDFRQIQNGLTHLKAYQETSAKFGKTYDQLKTNV